MCGNDVDLETALQTWTAAAMMPGNVEHKTHVLFGDGNTGKSTYLKVIMTALGDYAGSARASVFVSERESHPAELLPFVDKRLVVLPELPRGALRSDLLKTVSGGDAISVRGMRENPRTATPMATLFFSCNELPSIRLVDTAIKRRLLIWPFDNKPAKLDVQLGSKLVSDAHLGGVTSWLVDGLKAYVKVLASGESMFIPDAVANATAEYFKEADNIGSWRDACVEESGETTSTILYNSFVTWCEGGKRKPVSERSFGLWMGRNYARIRSRNGSAYPVSLQEVKAA